jgi:hypothetical protein
VKTPTTCLSKIFFFVGEKRRCEMDTITKGYLGQLLFEQEMIKRG